MYEMNPWWEEKIKEIGVIRNKYLDQINKFLSNKDIIFLTGLRRVGKSTIIKQIIFQLINDGINPKHICYLSLDAFIFRESSIMDLVRKYRMIHNLRKSEKIYLFLDEITTKKSFKQELKNLYDLGGVKIIASSSSSSLLIDKKAYLTGRSRTLLINPLDFNEFLIFKNYKSKKSEKYLLEKYFKEYMEFGGMPEYVLTSDSTYITNLVENIIYKDIIAFHGIRNIEVVKDLFKLLCERVGKQLSYNKIANVLDISKDTAKKMIGYFVEVYLFYIVEKDARSLNERIKETKKIYCADVGIKNVTTGFRDLGAIYENLVFLKIKSFNPKYFKVNGIEIDFKFKDTLLEAKFNSTMTDDQKKVFKNAKIKKKIIANGLDFFI